jgi:ComF family protein
VLYYGIYEGVLKEVIHLLKFNGVKRLSKPLSNMLSDLPISNADGIIPVPLHKNRLKLREFNQTSEVGNHLSKKLKIPIMLNVLRKVRDTHPQTEVTGAERLKNIRDAYKASDEVKELDLLLIDDVITTGATIRECSKTLIKAGAKSVAVIAIARSMPKQNT